jgi:hypothetical protein
MQPNVPRYVSPQERAEQRARVRRFILGIAIALPLLFAFVMYGYSDQAPHWVRVVAVNVDAFLGQPVLWLIRTMMAPGS